MMVDARATYQKALDSFEIRYFNTLAMDIMDRRASRDLEFGRRMIENRGRNHFDTAVRARRLIWGIQSKDDDYKDERFKARNNLAYALQESSRRVDGEEGDKQIEEAIELLQGAFDLFDATSNETHKNIVRANLAQALGLRAARKPGLAGQADIDRAKQLFAEVDQTLERDKDPRLWVIVRQFEAEFLRMVAERTVDREQAFTLMKSSFDMYQGVLPIVSRETAPNDWALVCAEMGYTFVASLPLVQEATRRQFAENAVKLFEAARPYLAAGGFRQDLARIAEQQTVASEVLK